MKFFTVLAMAVCFTLALLSGSRAASPVRSVPATLDLRTHAEASLNFLTRVPDRKQGFLPYFWTYFGEGPPELRHNHWDYCENPGRNLYGLIAARQVTSSLAGIEEERLYEREIYSRMREAGHGLTWRPAYSPFIRTKGVPEMNLWDNRSQFMGLMSLYMQYEEPAVRTKLESMIDGLERYGIRKGKYFYFEREDILLGHKVKRNHEPRLSQHSTGWITPLIEYWRLTGSERARRLAVGLANFTKDYHHTSVRPGRVLGISNVHGALFGLAGVIRTAAATGDTEMLEWARGLVDYAAENLASSFGWVQEMEGRDWMRPEDSHSTESCAIVDMIQCALLLADAGYSRYWDLVERYVRNYFVEAQLMDSAWLDAPGVREDNVQSSWTDVAERVRGCFVGWGAPNDWVNTSGRLRNAIQNCCGPHGAWAIFLVWRRLVQTDSTGVRVNMALNTEHPMCRVASYLPYEGRVDVVMYRGGPLKIRIPDGVDNSEVSCTVNGNRAGVDWDGDYLSLAGTAGLDTVSVSWPQKYTTTTEELDGTTYRVEWKGRTVVGIDPPGTVRPLFQRDHFRADTAPMKTEFDPAWRDVIDRALHYIKW
ncbi:MAG: hypothetical protein FVQ81_16645 [Candidatus Glassbacteria bacterium]|nr:hypothetical protein [Candidatus Glassbacteria bacterium]